MKKTLLIIFILLSCSVSTYADHFGQQEIRYEYNGTNYNVYLTVYKECNNNPVNAPSFADTVKIGIKSSSLAVTITKSLPVRSKDTFNLNCLNVSDACHSLTSKLPGYEKWTYYDTVSIPPAPDWVISFWSCCTLNNYVNVSSYTAAYVESLLNNLGVNNSNANLPSTNLFFLIPNDTVYYPLIATDVDNDSVVYEIVEQENNPGSPQPYSSQYGYTLKEPLGTGQVCKIDSVNHRLVLYNTNRGLYALGLKIKEYRNSKFISHQTKFLALRFDIPPTSTPKTNTFPFPVNNTNLSVITCPGKANSVMLSFVDSTATDSVYVDVIEPILPGWTFNKTVKPNLGRADVYINWLTPSNLATYPQFFFTLSVRDNECPSNIINYTLAVKTDSCLADSVWPGDANSDNVVNLYDPLAVAIAYNNAGTSRVNPNILWQPQACTSWGNVFQVDNVDLKHADCNGNGTSDNTDLTAISNNYGKNHGMKKNPPVALAGTTFATLFLDTTGIIFEAGKTLQIPIVLGTASSPIDEVYGIATSINADTLTLSSPVSVSPVGSWLSAGSSTMVNFSKNNKSNYIDWAQARTTHTNTSGYGTIGTLTLDIPITTADNTPLKIDFENTRIIDSIGRDITGFKVKGINTTIKNKLGLSNTNPSIVQATIVPNPSTESAKLILKLRQNTICKVAVTDIAGRTVWTSQTIGTSEIILPAQQLQSGIYIVKVTAGNESTILKWIDE